MTTQDENEISSKRIELSFSTDSVRSPVDPEQQLDLDCITGLLHQRLEQLKAQREQESREPAPATQVERTDDGDGLDIALLDFGGLLVAGNPSWAQEMWEFICPKCGNRTVHTVHGRACAHVPYIGARLERCQATLRTVRTVDLEVVSVGFCARCHPRVLEPRIRLVARFPDTPERELDIDLADGGLSCLKSLSRSTCTLSERDCQFLASWLRIDLTEANQKKTTWRKLSVLLRRLGRAK